MNGRTLARLRWQNGRLGVMLVNERNQRFFLYAEKLAELIREPGVGKEVKVRDRNPSRAVGYYPGQVIGCLTYNGGNATITLAIGDPYFNLVPADGGGLPEEFMLQMVFTIPRRELAVLHDAAALMLAQQVEFDERLQAAEATPLLTLTRESKDKKPASSES